MQLKQELERCERVIDAVVDAHHLGFNHAIENYSRILSLFNECKAQVRASPRGHVSCVYADTHAQSAGARSTHGAAWDR